MYAAFLLTLVSLFYRLGFVLAGLPAAWANFSPVTAVCLCTGAFFRRRTTFWTVASAILISDVAINAFYHLPLFDGRTLGTYGVYAAVFWAGRQLGSLERGKTFALLLGAVGSSCLFYLVTNSIDWYFDSAVPYLIPLYPRTWAGWAQALTSGHPGFPPTILFLGHSLASDLLFTGLFLVTQRVRSPGPRWLNPLVGEPNPVYANSRRSDRSRQS